MQFIRASVSDDRLAASACIRGGADGADITETLINAVLNEKGVLRTPERDLKVTALVEQYRAAPDQDLCMVVAEGRPPVHPSMGFIEIIAPEEKLEVAGNGAIDYRRKSVFRVVREGEHIATIHPPIEGVDGVDVRGGSLAAKCTIPFDFKCDSSVKVIEGGRIIALVPGLLVQKANSVRVSEELRISSHVDFSTGNIDFPGDLTILLGVRDCFQVRCGRDCRVGDLVEAAVIEVVRDLYLDRGMAAREIGRLAIGRDLHSTYLSNVTGTVGRDVVITSAMTHCNLLIGRSLNGGGAQIAGGEVVIGAASEIAVLGSDSAAPTSIVLGHIPEVEATLLRIIAMLTSLQQRIGRSRELAGVLSAQKNHLTPEQKEELAKARIQLASDESLRRKLTGTYISTFDVLSQRARPSLLVQAMIHEGVTVWIGTYRCTVKKDLRGPIKLWKNDAGELVFTLMSSGTTQHLSELFRVRRDDRFKPIPTPADLHLCDDTSTSAAA